MMRVIQFIGLWLMTSASLLAQNSLEGKVINANKEALPGASVVVDGLYGGTTNSSGEFKIANLEAGGHQLKVSFIGFETATQSISIPSSEKIIIQLTSKNLMTEEVIVSATWANPDGPQAQSSINKQELQKMNLVSDLPQLLELTPSVVSTSENGTGLGYSNIRIRGTDISRINVTVNGVPLNDAESQGVFWVNMPDFASSVEAIQIQRGVGTSSNGSAAFGASVNFRTNNPTVDPYGELQFTGGSFNTLKTTVSGGSGVLSNGMSFDARYTKLNSDGYIKRGFTDHEALALSGSWRNNNTLVKAIALLGREKTGITWWGVPQDSLFTDRRYNPAGEYTDDNGVTQYYDGQTDNYWQNHYQFLISHQLNDNFNINGALHLTTGEGYYQQYKEDEVLNDYAKTDAAGATSDITRQKWLDNTFYGYTVSLNYQTDDLKLSLGHSYNIYDGDHFGKVTWTKEALAFELKDKWYINTGLKNDFNVFLKGEYNITNQLRVYGDIQFRNISYELSGKDDDLVDLDQKHNWDFVNPKVGFSYQLNKYQKLYASYGMAQREPTRADLKDAMKKGGNATPKHEELNDFEIGYHYASSLVGFGANIYYMEYKDQLVLTGEVSSVGYPIMTNVEESYRGGIELQTVISPTSWFKWTFNATFSQNKIKDYIEYAYAYDENWAESVQGTKLGTTDISYSPEVIAGSQIQIKPTNQITVSLESKYVGEQYFDNTSSVDRQLASYSVQNIRFDYDLNLNTNIFKKAQIQLLINNIYNERYSNNAYGGNWYEQGTENTWAYYFPQAFRNYAAKLTLTF